MQKYYGIELLRFLSSLTIAIYHWGISFGVMKMEKNNPFESFLKFAYDFGVNAVPVFFVISGLVFATVYLSGEKRETVYNFTIKRFARLYPLHLLTLFLVLLLQTVFLKVFGKYELYTFNDLYHFFLNLTFLLGWGFEDGRSFNTPVWTVGQEMVIYYLFFSMIMIIKKHRMFVVLLIYFTILFIDKTKLIELSVIKNIISFSYFIEFVRLFFSGILIYFIINKFKNNLGLLFFSLFFLIFSFIGSFKLHIFCFSLVLLFVLMDKLNLSKKIKKVFTFLGSLTYSLYLLHTLTFLIFLFVLKYLNKIELLYLNLTFIFYLLFSIIISVISYFYFEKKANKFLRDKYIKI
jgi:peptidoglycan/LPS O-acetylase OafA/YrhL